MEKKTAGRVGDVWSGWALHRGLLSIARRKSGCWVGWPGQGDNASVKSDLVKKPLPADYALRQVPDEAGVKRQLCRTLVAGNADLLCSTSAFSWASLTICQSWAYQVVPPQPEPARPPLHPGQWGVGSVEPKNGTGCPSNTSFDLLLRIWWAEQTHPGRWPHGGQAWGPPCASDAPQNTSSWRSARNRLQTAIPTSPGGPWALCVGSSRGDCP